jgi:predicted phage terminase large subunit-like protein
MREIRPQAGPQELFLSSSADIVIYGGAAGGGKTYGLLLEPARHLHNPFFRAVIFRRTSPQITNPGGLLDEAQTLYPLIGGKATQPDSGITWKFPSGAVVRFAHMQHEKNRYDWQGAQVPLIAFDELTHFTEEQFFYMLSRNRSTAGIRPYMRATTNPDAGSWVARFMTWWIDPETGYAIPERAGVVRWFVRINEEIVWADSPDELPQPAAQPDEVGSLADSASETAHPPKSVTFIPARLQDNPILMHKDPGYLANLMALPLVERERLLGGNWKIMPSGGKVFNRAWFEIVPPHKVPPGGVECRFWDFAATEKKLKGDDPDYTASVLLRHVGDTYYVLDCTAAQADAGAVDRLFLSTTQRDRERLRRDGDKTRYMVRWEEEPGSAAKRDTRRLVRLLDGFDAGGVPARDDKIQRAKELATQAEHGFVVLVQGDWNEGWLTHMHHQPDWPHDDILDASSGAHRALTSDVTWEAATA